MFTGLKGKSAIVTGAGQGIGLEICKRLVQEGAFVLLNDIERGLAEEGARKCMEGSFAGRCIAFAGDASATEIIKKMVNEVIAQTGRLDFAVANTGITLFGEFFTYSEEDFASVLKTNLQSAFFLAQQSAIQMKQNGNEGAILLMSSVTAHQSHKNLAAYGMTKAATEMLARNLVTELSPYKIRINALAPGATLTERTNMDSSYLKTWSALTPLGQPADVRQIADAALFLLSDHASHITGQTLVIDGGWTAVSPQPE
jgi:3-oxoacyl-[acyl-carrier protein] reductase